MTPLIKVLFFINIITQIKPLFFFKKNLQQINLSPFTYNLKFKYNQLTAKNIFR